MGDQNPSGSCRLSVLLLCSALLGACLLLYSQTYAFAWDEGFHMLAAKLVKTGKRPYLDFVHAQTPLNAYWNAFWMRIFGESWRSIHALDALLVTIAVSLAAAFLRSRFRPVRIGIAGESVDPADPRVRGWGTATVVAVFVLAGANIDTVLFGPIAQAYPLGLLLIVSAFWLTVEAVDREQTSMAALAGLLSGAAAGSTLLTAPFAPVLLIWLLIYSPEGKRVARGTAFLTGIATAFVPLLFLLAQSPKRVIFGVLQYHMFYRRSDWEGATQHDLELLTSWIRSPQAILSAILALTGIWFVAKRSGWNRQRRGEFYLCGWLALAQGIHVSTAHPTFVQYYIFTVPFLGILASMGLFGLSNQFTHGEIATGVGPLRHIPIWPMVGVCALVILGTARETYDDHGDFSWPKMELVARKVEEVTPAGAKLYADEFTYFLTRRNPPRGNEYISSHKLNLPPAFSEFLHIIPQAEYDRRIAAGEFDTIENCDDESWFKERKLDEIYRQKAEISDCYVFWDRAPKK